MCMQYTPLGGVKPSKSAPHMSVRSYLAGLDIRSIDTHHEASAELSRSSGDDMIASWFVLLVGPKMMKNHCF